MEISHQVIDLHRRPTVSAPRSEEAHPAQAAVAQKPSHVEHGDGEGRVANTPENRSRIDRAIRALDIFNPNHPNTRFRYSVHAETGGIQVELYNYLTGEVVQTIPSDKLLDYSARMQELTGLVLEERA